MIDFHPMISLTISAKRFAAAALAGLIGFCVIPATAQTAAQHAPRQVDAVHVDGIIAVVNNEVITRNELRDRLILIEKRLKSQGIALPPRAQLMKQLLERMVVERAQIQMAKEAGIRVDDRMLDRAITRMAETNKLNLTDFRKGLERDGISYARFREEIRNEIIMQRLKEKEVINKIQVSDSEVDNYLASSGQSGEVSEEIRLAHILVRIPENATPEQIAARKARAGEALKTILAGGDFQQSAAMYSDSDEALKGGDLGWRSKDHLPQLFSDGVKDIKVGGVSDILKSANGFHILKVLDRRQPSSSSPGAAAVQQTHARHILIRVDQIVTADDAKRKLLELKQRLDNKAAKFEDLARLFSNDGSANKGGDLGWIYPGDTVPVFERAMNALKPGEISEPVESQFGFHLIQVLERKTDNLSQERQRMVARQAVRERRIEEATEDWLRQVRDSAYVEYRFEDR